MTQQSVFAEPGCYERLTEDEVKNLGIVLGAYRSIIGPRANTAYISVPITSGQRLFEAMRDNDAPNFAELESKIGKAGIWEKIIQPNIEAGARTSRVVTAQNAGLCCILPSVFEAKKWRWSESAYMALWYRVLGEQAGQHFLAEGWEYSVGCAKEVLLSMFLQWDMFSLPMACDRYRHFFPFRIQPVGNDAAAMTEFRQALARLSQMQVRRVSGPVVDVPYRLDSALLKMAVAIKNARDWGLPYHRLFDVASAMASIPGASPIARVARKREELMCQPVFEQACDTLNEILAVTVDWVWLNGIRDYGDGHSRFR